MSERLLDPGLSLQPAWVLALGGVILLLELRGLFAEPVWLTEEGEEVVGSDRLGQRLIHGVRFLVFGVLCAALALNLRFAGFLLGGLLLATGFWPALAYATSFAKGVEEESGELPTPLMTGLVAAGHLAIARGVLVSLVLAAEPSW